MGEFEGLSCEKGPYSHANQVNRCLKASTLQHGVLSASHLFNTVRNTNGKENYIFIQSFYKISYMNSLLDDLLRVYIILPYTRCLVNL